MVVPAWVIFRRPSRITSRRPAAAGHGDYRTIVLAPGSVQELTEIVPLAFDLADKYRNPVIILGDGMLGQMMEPVDFDNLKPPAEYPKDWILTGAKGRPARKIYSLLFDTKEEEEHNWKLFRKFQQMEQHEVRYERFLTDDAEMIVVAYGIGARIVKGAIKRLRQENMKVGMIRPITLWPFPAKVLKEMAKTVTDFFVFEMSAGQMIEDVRLALEGKGQIHFYGRPGGVNSHACGAFQDHLSPLLPSAGEEEEEIVMKKVYSRPKLLKPAHFHYCPGCGHGIINRLIMEVVEEMNLQEKAICVAPAGCGMLLYNYFEIDTLESAHGRGAAVATGIKRTRPDNLVFSYQGDGDLAAIGTAEGFHAAKPGGEHHHHLCQQRCLRYDRRTDGAYDAPRSGDDDHTGGAKLRHRRTSCTDLRGLRRSRRHDLPGAGRGEQAFGGRKGKKGHRQGLSTSA